MALHIDYYASLNSPWTHMGAARIEAMAAAHGASLRIYPVDFGEIFANSGGLPLPKRVAATPGLPASGTRPLARSSGHPDPHPAEALSLQRGPDRRLASSRCGKPSATSRRSSWRTPC